MYLELLYEALTKELGIVVETDSPQRLQQYLYAERRKACDPQLDNLVFAPSRFVPTELWIVKKSINHGQAEVSDQSD